MKAISKKQNGEKACVTFTKRKSEFKSLVLFEQIERAQKRTFTFYN